MASPTLLKDLEDNFFLCPVCLDQLKEPKLLPCLHRYCCDCLKTVIKGSIEGKVECPMCKQQCDMPENGADGFKTDFHTKNILEFIQLQKHFENKELKDCISCLKKTNVSAYCFKCRDFLCDQCHNIHVTSRMFIDHEKRTLKLDNSELGSLTLEKLSSLSENPRCRSHEQEYAKLCCTTCGNEPVCMICTYSDKHKGHALRDVSDVAKTERDLLKRNLDELKKWKNKLYEVPKKIEASKKQLNENVSLKTEQIIEQHRQQSDKIKSKLDDQKVTRERGVSDIESRRKAENDEINTKCEDEFQRLKQKFDKIREETQAKFDNECQEFSKTCDKIEENLLSVRTKLDDNLCKLKKDTELYTSQNKQKLSEISDYCDRIIKRYENFTSTSSSILASEVDWTDVRFIPDLNSAWEVLIEEVKREFPDIEGLSVVDIREMTRVTFNFMTITEHEENVFEGIINPDWKIDDITSSADGNVIITGSALKGYSYITVIDKKGGTKRQDLFKSEKVKNFDPVRCCSYLRGSKVATVCQPDEIGIYDVSNGSYMKKFISEITKDWSEDQSVLCVSTESVSNHILVGTNVRYVYVFDDQLAYIHAINLPDKIIQSYEIALHEDNLYVCDFVCSKKAYAVTAKGPESKVEFEFIQPNQSEGKWSPSGVCTDKNRFIYILWCENESAKRKLVQYSRDGRQVLRVREVSSFCDYVAPSENTLVLV